MEYYVNRKKMHLLLIWYWTPLVKLLVIDGRIPYVWLPQNCIPSKISQFLYNIFNERHGSLL